MVEQHNMNILVNSNEQMGHYTYNSMKISNGYMQGLTRQVDTNDVATLMPIFSDRSGQNFNELMRCPCRAYVGQQGGHCIIRKLIMMIVCIVATHYDVYLKRDNVPVNKNIFHEQSYNYGNDHVAQQTELTLDKSDIMRKIKYPPDSN